LAGSYCDDSPQAVQEINMDNTQKLQADVSMLATAEGRKVGTPGHDTANNYLQSRFDSLNLEPYNGKSFELPYQSNSHKFANLIGVIPGNNRELAPILIGAHYDSVIESYCADDNAAAVAIALSAAESFTSSKLSRDVVIALFDAEEPPYYLGPDMGSVRFYNEQRRPQGFHAVIIMDLVGHDVQLPLPLADSSGNLVADLLFMTGAESHEALADVVRLCLPGSELPLLATLNRNVGDMSDHHIFRRNGVPYLFLSCGQWSHYHRTTDTPDRLNYTKMAKICDFLGSLCRTLDSVELRRSALPTTSQSLECGVTDTTHFEIELLEKVFGSYLQAILRLLGLPSLASRRDLDELASKLQSFVQM
jgi:hypothetical protein